jgi:hypothetical protein
LAEIEADYADTTITITEQDGIEVVFATEAETYNSVLTYKQPIKGPNLTMDYLEDPINQLWIQGGGSPNKHTSDDVG